MGLLCARLSCRHQAAASLQFNASESQVIIIDLTEPTGGIPLCLDHVKTRTAPMGWTMVDNRLAMPRRHLESVPQPDLAEPRTTVLELDEGSTVPPEVEGPHDRPSVRRPADRGFPWEWAASIDDDTGEGTDAFDFGDDSADDSPTTPLLSRAFRNAPVDEPAPGDPDDAS